MLRRTIFICTTLALQWNSPAQAQDNKEAVHVQIVATASEYVPRSTTVSHPGHAYTNCMGSTSFFGRFSSYGDSGSVSGTAETDTHCSTTFSPPTETTLTTYRRVNYTIAKSDQALYLLSCTQTWKPTAKERVLLGVMGAAEAGSGNNSGNSDRVAANLKGKWSECPAFGIGAQYTLTVHNTSDARLVGTAGDKPNKLDYLSSVALPAPSAQVQMPSAPEAKALLASDALSIGAVTLRLGMPKDAALSELGKHYALQEDLPSTELFDNWRIQDKTRGDEFLGDVRFRSGKLTLASKVWTHESKEYSGADAAEIIYKVLSKFEAEGKVNCVIQTFTSLQPSGPGHLEFRRAEITCGHRQIDVTLMWQSGPGWVQVNESITDEPEMPRK
jgi:hypothetical protein